MKKGLFIFGNIIEKNIQKKATEKEKIVTKNIENDFVSIETETDEIKKGNSSKSIKFDKIKVKQIKNYKSEMGFEKLN